ncbi:MAG: hypothetical protein QM228_07965 [Atribacterota bacterium]|nr:hypothetical protein [Atribacterota bacterium]
MGEVVKLPQTDDWKNLLELFLFEKKLKEELPALFPITGSMLQYSSNAFLVLYVQRKSLRLAFLNTSPMILNLSLRTSANSILELSSAF